MSRTFKSMSALEAAIKKKVNAAVREVVDKSVKDAHNNVDNFYTAPGGVYQRTGQLADSPEGEVYVDDGSVFGEIRLNTNKQYSPSGRDTQIIYGYAENGGLLGNGGFWEKTKEDVERNIQNVFSKNFK